MQIKIISEEKHSNLQHEVNTFLSTLTYKVRDISYIKEGRWITAIITYETEA